MDILYSKRHQNWCGNMEIMGIKSFAPLSKGMHANAPIVNELMIVRQLFVKNFYAGFHENVANGLAADTRTCSHMKHFFYGSLIQIQCSFVRYLVPATKLLQGLS
jgi:hypothetical protein